MKLRIGKDELLAFLITFIIGAAVLFILPKYEHVTNNVELGNIALSQAPSDVVTAYNSTYLISIPVSWAAPWVGSCYLTIDVRPEGAGKGEPETPEWNANHLIRAVYSGRWFIQKWINVFVLTQNKGQTELKYAIADPHTQSVDVYAELKCDDELLSQTHKTVSVSPQ